MTTITAALVKSLRDKTGAGMMDAKKALVESDGNMEAATDWLRTKGLSRAAGKSGRLTAEGLVGGCVSPDGKTGALVELNAETDFVARNQLFQNALQDMSRLALAGDGTRETLAATPAPDGNGCIEDMIKHLVATIGENIILRRTAKITADTVACYIHSAAVEGMGKIGVLAGLNGSGDLAEPARKIAMHIAASAPAAGVIADLDPGLVARERQVLTEQAEASGKPAAVVEKMVEGRMRKFYQDVVLVEQAFVMNPDQTVGAFLDGHKAQLSGFVMFKLGEGVNKAQDDFAAEVATLTAR